MPRATDEKDDRETETIGEFDRANSNSTRVPHDRGSAEGAIEEQTTGSRESGYISIKDFAYDPSDPLHHGYTEDFHNESFEAETDESDEEDDGTRYQDKRHSIVLPTDYVINRLAVALYDFEPENDNELGLKEGDIVFISYRHGQGWLVAENQHRTKTGLVPEEFVTYVNEDDENWDEYEEEFQDRARPFYLTHFIIQGMQDPSSAGYDQAAADFTNGKVQSDESGHEENDEWEDIDHFQEDLADKLKISNT
ncbi:NBP2 (YDR162C) [Zygosaccharomyces parabailii]|nr:NBP2 (YDR162C) [Zygosaccharomyces parabailii]CDH10466.1 related to NAP1-binding protein 2 [Zygosaccharomyces bailii ISA1307]